MEGSDPCWTEPLTSRHPNPLNGAPRAVAAVQEIARLFKEKHPDLVLRVRAMSLPFGGLCDIHNDWNPPHFEHRFGRNADIGILAIGLGGKPGPIEFRANGTSGENDFLGIQRHPLNEGHPLPLYSPEVP